jgi:hypothetical protein
MFWNKLDRAAKEGYVNGYADAMSVSVAKIETLITAGRTSRETIDRTSVGMPATLRRRISKLGTFAAFGVFGTHKLCRGFQPLSNSVPYVSRSRIA